MGLPEALLEHHQVVGELGICPGPKCRYKRPAGHAPRAAQRVDNRLFIRVARPFEPVDAHDLSNVGIALGSALGTAQTMWTKYERPTKALGFEQLHGLEYGPRLFIHAPVLSP